MNDKTPRPAKPPRGPRPKPGGPKPPRELPAPRPISYYRDDGTLDPELLEAKAEERAKALKDVKVSQLRRFYDEVLNLRQRLAQATRQDHDSEAAFARLRADFKMLKAKAVYAYGRGEGVVPRALLLFFIDHVHAVQTARDFEAFYKHFQAVVAFHRYFREEQDKELAP